MMALPTNPRFALLKSGFSSADASTRVRASVCKGSFAGRQSRACRAESFADLRACSDSGDGYGLRASSRECVGGPTGGTDSASPSVE